METVTSRDGTPIAFERTGSGPPLVLVHGVAGARGRWAPILPALAEEYTVYTIDRRGRGGSGDSDCYAIEREFEDVVAVVEAIDEPVNLLGHSYGGTCVLEAALLTGNINKLIAYEPSAQAPGSPVEEYEKLSCLQALLAAGDREGMLVTFMRDMVGIPEREIEQVRQTPAWQARVAAAHTIPRELEADAAYRFDPERFRSMTVPTLLLTGEESPPMFSDPVHLVDAALPNSRISVLEGQQHLADVLAPELFVRAVLEFLRD